MTFSLSPKAVAEIQRQFVVSGLQDPVASLIESSGVLPTSNAVMDAVRRGASQQELHRVAKQHYREIATDLDLRLTVGLYPREECKDLLEVNGIWFAMTARMCQALRAYTLDYDNGNFLLRKGEKVFVRLMDLEADDAT